MGIEQIVTDGQLLVAVLIALAAGLVSFLSPCVLPLIPGYLAYVSGIAGAEGSTAAADPKRARAAERRRMVLGSVLFVLGFTVIFMLLNILFGSVGLWIWEWQDLLLRIMGVVVIVLGLVFMGAFSKLQVTNRLKFKPRVGLVGAPLLGVVFAIGWAPCIGPTLGIVLTLAAQSGSSGRGAILGLAYCIGLGLPFILAAFGFSWMASTMAFFKRHIRAVNLIGGLLLIVIGLLMVTGVWNIMMNALQGVVSGVTPIL